MRISSALKWRMTRAAAGLPIAMSKAATLSGPLSGRDREEEAVVTISWIDPLRLLDRDDFGLSELKS
ncbi:hypothetical protein [Amorphus sp. MBR-141]